MSQTDDTSDGINGAGRIEPRDLPATRTLRWWPAAVILAVMAVLKVLPSLFDSPPLPVMMVGFMGPAAAGLLLVVWWLFASRATGREKLIGLGGLLTIAVVSILLSHFSMQGMSTTIFQLPAGLAAFALPLVVLARRPGLRLPAAMLGAVIGFGYWDLLVLHGTTGRFQPEFGWRWAPSAEDAYLRSLARSSETATIDPASLAATISRETAEWPDFRGRHRDGIVTGLVVDTEWAAEPPRLVWKSLIGPGWSSFTVAGDRLFTQEQRGEEEAVVCLSAETGDILWATTYPGRFWEAIGGAGPRATPTIGDNQLFALGADGQLTAMNPVTGEIQWKRNLREDAERQPPMWGWSASPLLVDSLVIVHAGGSGDNGVLAYDAATGERVWGAPSGDHSYSSPQTAQFAGVQGILMMTNAGLQFLDATNGTIVWDYQWPLENYRAIQPLVHGNSVLIATSLGEGTRRITVERTGEQWSFTEDWTSRDMKPEFNDYVAYDGHLYGFDGNILACIDLETGTRKWKRGRYGNGQVLLLRDAGQLLVTSEKGELVLVEANPDEFVEVAKAHAIDGKTWNHPVLVGNRLYIRNGQEAACFELR